MRVGIFSGTQYTREEMVIKVRGTSAMAGAFLASDVTTEHKYVVSPPTALLLSFA